MKTGGLFKNITDTFLVIMAFLALLGLVIGFVTFDGEGYLIDHPRTNEEIEVRNPMDDPYIAVYVKIFIWFTAASIIGFKGRRVPLLSVLFMAVLMCVVLSEYANGGLEQKDFAYIVFGTTGFIGSIVYLVCDKIEKKEEKTVEESKLPTENCGE